MAIAKVFWSGRSQAVRLPKEFRFDGDEVHVRREGSSVILDPIEDEWAWLDKFADPLPTGAFDASEREQGEFERPEPLA
jgi:antitoxin VapB